MTRILILGGTTQARQLATCLADRADFTVTLSLAGRTAAPAPHPVPVRVGGFGGPQGLADYLAEQDIDVLVDATHPYAAVMARNAARAADAANTPLLALRRPPWTAATGDRWTEVDDMAGAIRALGTPARRAFLALGRNEIEPFAGAPQHHYLVRSVDPVEPRLAVPHAVYVTGRGPFAEADEAALLAQHRIEIIVCKNSGGSATYGKIAAARARDIPVIMLRRPDLPDVTSVETVAAAMHWLDHVPAPSTARGV